MNTYANKKQKKKRQSAASEVAQRHGDRGGAFQVVNHRSEAVAQLELQAMADNYGAQTIQRQMATFKPGPNEVAQLKRSHSSGGIHRNGNKLEVIQREDGDDEPTEDEMDAAYREFMANPDLGTSYYQVDAGAGRQHAYNRHTRRGIWQAGQVLTAHPNRVAVFLSDSEFETALANMPAEKDQWTHNDGGRYDAEVNGVHYQGTLLGTTMSLFSCYPITRSRQFPKAGVARVLADALREGLYGDFIEGLAGL